ncbi:hypothetical protein [Embleya sp. NPDC020630]|uniref:hypothetical protein n=1 Tax=Embleya sp. NPDC020630 TaxID=3363979 RepID=UPI00378F6143
MKKPGILAVLTLALVAVLSPVPTAQAAQAPTPHDATVGPAIPVTGTSTARTDGCPWSTPGGPAEGTFLCGSRIQPVSWADGRDEYFGLGTDRQVWHSYQYSAGGAWSPWGRLGNSNNVRDGVDGWFSGGALIVQVLGGDNRYWCNVYSGGWSNWGLCT